MDDRIALVVGIGNYDYYPLLQYCPPSASDVYDILTAPHYGRCDPDRSVLMTFPKGKSISSLELDHAIKQIIRKLEPSDQFIFYFCGHGQVFSGDFFLVLSETPNDDPLECYDFSNLVRVLRYGNVNKAILIVDTCHSAAMFRSTKDLMGDWKPSELPQGYGFFAASGEIEFAQQVPELERTLFSYYLCEGIKSGNVSSSNVITLEQLRNYVNQQIQQKHPKVRQTAHTWVRGSRNLWLTLNPIYTAKHFETGLPSSLLRRLRNQLVESIAMMDDGALEELFGSQQLSGLKKRMPKTYNRRSLVDYLIDRLYGSYDEKTNDNSLVLFLRLLSKQSFTEDSWNLMLLADEVDLEITGDTYLEWDQTARVILWPLLNRIKSTLLRCDEFESDERLKTVFIDKRMRNWRDKLSVTASRMERVEAVIALLFDKYSCRTKINALYIFARMLGELYNFGDSLSHDILSLAQELNSGILPIDTTLRANDMTISHGNLDYLVEEILRCGCFNTDESFRAIFVDQRIGLWRSELPEMSNLRQQVHITVEFLCDKFTSSGQNGLVLLLLVLRDRLAVDDGCCAVLQQLASSIEQQLESMSMIEIPEQNVYSSVVKLPSSLRKKALTTLRWYSPFEYSWELQFIFGLGELDPWKDLFPNLTSLANWENVVIDFLSCRYHSNGENALVLFLETLSESWSTSEYRKETRELANDVRKILVPRSKNQ